MFRKLVVAYNESPEAQRALISAIQLAVSLNAELLAVTVIPALPGYTAFAEAGDVSSMRTLQDDQVKSIESLQARARVIARGHGVELISHFVEGNEIKTIVEFLRKEKADLLVIGLHQHDFYISRLWSTVYGLAQEAPCSVLGVH